jgi:hypothetical protein
MKNTICSLIFFLLFCLSAKCQVGCPIFPSKSKTHRKSFVFPSGYLFLNTGANARIYPNTFTTGYWGLGLEQGVGKHFALSGAIGGGGFAYARIIDNGEYINNYRYAGLKYYHVSILNGWGIGLDVTKQFDTFEPIIYKINYLYGAANYKKTYSTLFTIGAGMSQDKAFFVGGSVQFCIRMW